MSSPHLSKRKQASSTSESDFVSEEETDTNKIRSLQVSPTASPLHPSSGDGGIGKKSKTDFDKIKFKSGFEANLEAAKDSYESEFGKGTEALSKLLEKDSTLERDLCRVAFHLSQIKPSRVCVSVAKKGRTLYLFANNTDIYLEIDALKILDLPLPDDKGLKKRQITRKGLDIEDQILNAHMKQNFASAMSAEKQVEKSETAERRFEKIVSLKGLIDKVVCPLVYTKNKHAEMRLLDSIHKELTSGSKEFYIGIDKLCCGKCYLGVLAFCEAYGRVAVQGSHFATYNSTTGWPMPRFLVSKPEALELFLGKKAYAEWLKSPELARDIVEKEKLEGAKYIKTEFVSSGEEDSDTEESKDDK